MKRFSLLVGLVLLGCSLTFFLTGWYALVPAFIVLGLAIMSRRALEPLIIGCSAGFLLMPQHGDPALVREIFGHGAERGLTFPMNMLSALEDTISRAGHNYGLMWVVLLSLLYGAFIQLLVSSGGISALAAVSRKYVRTRRHSMIMAALLSVLFFLDDYLNALTTGNTAKPITDRFNLSREKLALIISLICLPVAVISPVSTWTLFYGTQLLTINTIAAVHNNPISAFTNTILYNFSAWVSLIVAALVVWGILPDFKSIKKAEIRAALPAGAGLPEDDPRTGQSKGKLWHFFVPLLVLMVFTILPYPTQWHAGLFTLQGITANIDGLRGIATAFAFTYILYYISGVMPLKGLSDNFIRGMESMTLVLILLGFTYMLKEVQYVLGFNSFVGEKLSGVLNPALLPAVIFLVVAAISWSTSSGWGVFAVLIPLTTVLAVETGAHFWLVQGALVSGTVWGTAACFYSDNRLLISQSTGINMIDHATTQFPYQVLILSITGALYLLAGLFLQG
jgi:tetracycline resistance efflux pump